MKTIYNYDFIAFAITTPGNLLYAELIHSMAEGLRARDPMLAEDPDALSYLAGQMSEDILSGLICFLRDSNK